MSTNVIFCDKARGLLLEQHNELGHTWRQIASTPDYAGVKPGTLCRFATTDYEPLDDRIREILQLPYIIIRYKDPITGRFIKKE